LGLNFPGVLLTMSNSYIILISRNRVFDLIFFTFFLFFIIGPISLITKGQTTPKSTEAKPNVIIILADDLGYSD